MHSNLIYLAVHVTFDKYLENKQTDKHQCNKDVEFLVFLPFQFGDYLQLLEAGYRSLLRSSISVKMGLNVKFLVFILGNLFSALYCSYFVLLDEPQHHLASDVHIDKAFFECDREIDCTHVMQEYRQYTKLYSESEFSLFEESAIVWEKLPQTGK